MNTDKLVKAIQIIVKEELKAILPTLIKEGVRVEMKKLLKENSQLREAVTKKPTQPTFMDREVNESIKPTPQPQRILSRNPLLNEVLNQTQPFNGTQNTQSPYAGAPSEDEYKTMNFNTSDVHTMGAANIAEKMGYGDMSTGPSKSGLGVSTGLAGLDRIMNRDNSELVKAFDKSKGGWRPGM
tara:strand:+ start:10497 stop:11045 length:549 start_codon:yes stop_codon:yes gene_type:complete